MSGLTNDSGYNAVDSVRNRRYNNPKMQEEYQTNWEDKVGKDLFMELGVTTCKVLKRVCGDDVVEVFDILQGHYEDKIKAKAEAKKAKQQERAAKKIANLTKTLSEMGLSEKEIAEIVSKAPAPEEEDNDEEEEPEE